MISWIKENERKRKEGNEVDKKEREWRNDDCEMMKQKIKRESEGEEESALYS